MHVAIIMDGNGRWAEERGWPREAGHRSGADAVRRTVEAAPKMGVRTLTLYAFSSDNWKRPAREVATLMRLFRRYLTRETGRCVENGIRLSVIGRRDRLPLPSDVGAAIVAYLRDDLAAATQSLRAALRISPRDPDALFYLGVLYAKAGQARKARKALYRCIRYDTDGKWDDEAHEQLRVIEGGPQASSPPPSKPEETIEDDDEDENEGDRKQESHP